MTTHTRQPMRGTAKRPVKKVKSHQIDLFEQVSMICHPSSTHVLMGINEVLKGYYVEHKQ